MAIGLGPKCRGGSGRISSAVPGQRVRHARRTINDPQYVNVALFAVNTDASKEDKSRRRSMLKARLPFRCGDVSFYPMGTSDWQSSGGSRVIPAGELTRILEEAGMI